MILLFLLQKIKDARETEGEDSSRPRAANYGQVHRIH